MKNENSSSWKSVNVLLTPQAFPITSLKDKIFLLKPETYEIIIRMRLENFQETQSALT